MTSSAGSFQLQLQYHFNSKATKDALVYVPEKPSSMCFLPITTTFTILPPSPNRPHRPLRPALISPFRDVTSFSLCATMSSAACSTPLCFGTGQQRRRCDDLLQKTIAENSCDAALQVSVFGGLSTKFAPRYNLHL